MLYCLLFPLSNPSKLTPWRSVFLWEVNIFQAGKEITHNLNTTAHQWSLSEPTHIKATIRHPILHAFECYPPTYIQVFLVVSSLQFSYPKQCRRFFNIHVTCHAPLDLFCFVTLMVSVVEYKWWSYPLSNILQPQVTSTLSHPNMLHSTPRPNASMLTPLPG